MADKNRIERFEFEYLNGEAYCVLEVDYNLFTTEKANDTLEFFTWDYDDEANPIDEVVKKYALKAIEFATSNYHNVSGVIDDFKETEGFYNVDGAAGIKLIRVEGIEFSDYNLDLMQNTK